jgi:hypothetical protein
MVTIRVLLLWLEPHRDKENSKQFVGAGYGGYMLLFSHHGKMA